MNEVYVWIAIGVISLLLIFIKISNGKDNSSKIRSIPAFDKLDQINAKMLESGKRLIIGLGSGYQNFLTSINGIIGLQAAKSTAKQSLLADEKPLILSGDGSLGSMSQVALAETYKSLRAIEQYKPENSFLAGTTPISYAASVMAESHAKENGGLFLVGHIRPEMMLPVDLVQNKDLVCVVSADEPGTQAICFPNNDSATIGEELYGFASRTEHQPWLTASLKLQDLLRILIVVSLVVAIILKLLGII